MSEVRATPAVRATARRLRVDLAKVKATGVGGRIRVSDVTSAARNNGEGVYASLFGDDGSPRRPVVAASAPAGSAVVQPSRFAGQVQVSVSPYAANPLLDDLRSALPAAYAAASRESPPPTLFEGGDLPPFTTSGIDPALLRQLPWQARHAAARADRAQAQVIFETYGGGSGDAAAVWAAMGLEDDQANRDYYDRMFRWGSGLDVRPASPGLS